MSFTLSLVVPCYNEARTIEKCVEKVLSITKNKEFNLEIVIVDDASTDGSWEILQRLKEKYNELKIFKHEKNRGKGAALRSGFTHASGDYIGIQDADDEYEPMDYHALLEPLVQGKADVVYGSRYLRPDTRRVLYFWHTWMNKTLTRMSNMFTNLDITDMETCYKLFKKEVIHEIAPKLKEERFGFEPEITAKVAQSGCKVYECAISYNPRTYEEGKKIGWKDGVRALYCIFHYGAHSAPLPMQLIIYFFIGAVSLLINLFCFIGFTQAGLHLNISIILAFGIAAFCNYLLCIAVLFRHKARWNTPVELLMYIISVLIMSGIDFVITYSLINLVPLFATHWSLAKFIASLIGFIGNFALRKLLVFPEKKRKAI